MNMSAADPAANAGLQMYNDDALDIASGRSGAAPRPRKVGKPGECLTNRYGNGSTPVSFMRPEPGEKGDVLRHPGPGYAAA
jgi:hypothetical protein